MPPSLIDTVGAAVLDRYEGDRRLLTFPQLVELFEKDPYRLTRNAVQYLRDAIEHYRTREVPGIGGTVTRWRVFDAPFDDGVGALAGQEDAQQAVVDFVTAAARQGRVDRMIVLHGPNGSGKSSLVELLHRAMEDYSHQPEGAMYALRWIFPKTSAEGTGLGFGQGATRPEERESYALLDAKDIASRIVCELRENPLFAIPDSQRAAVLEGALEHRPDRRSESYRSFLSGNLGPKSKALYEGLLAAYHGDWRKVVRHVQVERIFISRRYRVGAVVTQPQGTADAALRPLSGDAGIAGLPPFLQSLTLHEVLGDLADANRGLLEFSDFFKRNPELFKYLLTTTEKGFVSVGNQLVELDIVFTATANERHLDGFKQYPEFASFQGRMHFVRVPYLRQLGQESAIYESLCKEVARTHAVAPHIARTLGLFATLTRMERPRKESYRGDLAKSVVELTPLEKVWLYEEGRAPDRLDPDERREMERALPAIRDEFALEAAYEGRTGASVRDLSTVLLRGATGSTDGCVGPSDLERELRALVADKSLYRFLQVEADGAYHDPQALVGSALTQLGEWILDDVHTALSLVRESEYERRLERYIRHVLAHRRGETVRDPDSGTSRPPDDGFMATVEKDLPVHGPVDDYRQSLVSRLAAYAVDHPKEQPPDFGRVFPDLVRALKDAYFEKQRSAVTDAIRHMLLLDRPDEAGLSAADRAAARSALASLRDERGYPEGCLRDVLGFALRHVEGRG